MAPASQITSHRSGGQSWSVPVMFVLAVSAAGALGSAAILSASMGPLTAMMAGHILAMNVVAPLLAAALAARLRGLPPWLGRGNVLVASAGLQIVVLWSAHAPPLLSHLSATAHLLVHLILFASALFFWSAVFAQDGRHRWRGLLVLLITGKVFCLLGVLLVFAPRLLYEPMVHGRAVLSPTLADQQFAGLLMIVACPLSYVLAAIVIAARWLSDISRTMPEPIGCTMGDR